MKVEDTIQYLYDNHPSLFQERWQCLNHLFCVIGNGYEWENGELVTKCANTKKYKPKLNHEGRAVQRKVEDQTMGGLKEVNISFYPIYDGHSFLTNPPEDIKDDWREALEETKILVLTYPVRDAEYVKAENARFIESIIKKNS